MAALYSTRLIQAFEFATSEHKCQARKGTDIFSW